MNSSTEGITIGGGGFLLSNEYLLEHTIPVTLVVGETYYLSQYMFTEALAVGSSIRDPETGQIIGHRSATVGVDFFNTGSFNFVDPSGQVTFNQTVLSIPEPSSFLLSLISLGFLVKRKRQ